jgi:hypothetical protein
MSSYIFSSDIQAAAYWTGTDLVQVAALADGEPLGGIAAVGLTNSTFATLCANRLTSVDHTGLLKGDD